MRHVLSRMALQRRANGVAVSSCASDGTGAPMPKALWARLFTPAAKFVICKRGIPFVAEAMEVLGGIGYCGESGCRGFTGEMPVNGI